MFTRNMLKVYGAAVVLTAFAFIGCSDKEDIPASPQLSDEPIPTAPQSVLDELAELQQIASADDRGLAYWTGQFDHPPVVVPAGSVNALAAAIAAAGPGGTVVLARGLHTENATVAVTQRVSIIGECGAVLKSAVTHSNEIPTIVRPAIYVHGAERVKIWNIDFRPTGAVGGNAILLENSPRATIGWNSFEEFQYTILLQNSSSSTVAGNRIVCNDGWLSGNPIECDGIININGSDVRIADNDITDGTLNAFCSGGDGFYMHNRTRNGFVGMILCKIPDGSFQLPSGAIIGSQISATRWFVQNNIGSGNLYAGLLVIDGANNNRLVNNGGTGNGAYDLELLGVTCLFGFQTPTSFNNTVIAGSYRNISVNDFGQNNTLRGFTSVTNTVSAPCP